MRIALTHNLKLTGGPDEAEFDSPETIDAIAAALERAGHDVERIEVSGPASRVIARLEALVPDLIFNTAEGHKGKTREAFYPSVFDELGMPYTGSDPYTLCITLDKMLSKRVLSAYGVPTPRARLVTSATIESGALDDVPFPVIVKPNFEGSSKGIYGSFSVCQDVDELSGVVEQQLGRFEAGLIVERYLRGIDVACAFVDGAFDDGIVEPVEFIIDPQFSGLYNVYDYQLKNVKNEHVTTRLAELPASVIDRIKALTRRIVRALDLKDFGRCEFRVTPPPRSEGYEVHFLEVDALPTLEPGAGIFVGARQRVSTTTASIRAIVRSACKRQGLGAQLEQALPAAVPTKLAAGGAHIQHQAHRTPRKRRRGRVRLAQDHRRHHRRHRELRPHSGPARGQLQTYRTCSPGSVPMSSSTSPRASRGRGREAQVPALCELLGIPYSGSDATTLHLPGQGAHQADPALGGDRHRGVAGCSRRGARSSVPSGIP